MFGKLMEMQKQMEAVKQRLENASVEASSPENRVMARMNGNRKLTALQIDEEWLKNADAEEVAELVQVASIGCSKRLNNSMSRKCAASPEICFPECFLKYIGSKYLQQLPPDGHG
jgi:DNA-binding protein YbaB